MSEKELREEMGKLKDEIVHTMRWYLAFSFGVIMLLSGWIGYLSKEMIDVKKQHESMRSDFGLSLLITASQHTTAIGYQELVNKYYPSRGVK